MSEYKPITGELRNSMTYDITTAPNGVSKASIDTVEFVNLCDAIDSIHAQLERENESLKAELDRARGEWDFWESTHIELPKDGGDEYICAGDKLDGYGKTIEVVELRYGRSGWVLISRDGNAYADTFAFTHHHTPTVEDVLREFAEKITDSQIPGVHPTYEEAIAEYAKRLTLAGDAE